MFKLQKEMPELRKILLADDDEITNFLNESILAELNIAQEIKVFTDGSEAFQHIHEDYQSHNLYPELVIFDNKMLEMNGIDFIKALQKKDKNINKEIVFVLITSGLNPKEIYSYKELCVKEIILKPLTSEAVMDVFNKYWKEKKATAADK